MPTSSPQVAYRETTPILPSARAVQAPDGGRGMYGDVELTAEPLPPGTGIQFEWKDRRGTVPRGVRPASRRGVREASREA